MLAIVSLVVGGPPLRLGRGMGGNHARNNHLSGINFPCGFELVRTNHKVTRRGHPACAIIRRPYKDPLACWPLFLSWLVDPFVWEGGMVGIMRAIIIKAASISLVASNSYAQIIRRRGEATRRVQS